MKVHPIINTIRPISFGNNIQNIQTPTETKGLLPVQSTDTLKFEKNLKLTNDADAVQSNPLKALGYKVVKAYNVLFSPRNGIEGTSIYAPYYGVG